MIWYSDRVFLFERVFRNNKVEDRNTQYEYYIFFRLHIKKITFKCKRKRITFK